MRREARFTIVVMAGCLLAGFATPVAAQSVGPSNFVPRLSLAFVDPETGARKECGEDCRRFSVPAGVELEVHVQIEEEGAVTGDRGVTWDLWFNQPGHPFPGFDLVPCNGPGSEGLDRGCWQALNDRVDRETWDILTPDMVCVPNLEEGACRDTTVRLMMDPDFDGARRPGVYHVALWVNRFSAVPEGDDFDNFAGPFRVTVEPRAVVSSGGEAEPAGLSGGSSEAIPAVIMSPSSPRPYGLVIVPDEVETAFTLTSMRSQRLLEFAPAVSGEVTVEVVQSGVFENMVVEVRKVSTGEVLAEAQGKGALRLVGRIDNFHLMDDRNFEVVVVPGQGSRGIRGTMRVIYPARLRYMVDP